jgi:Domain of unknown function (DUF4832)
MRRSGIRAAVAGVVAAVLLASTAVAGPVRSPAHQLAYAPGPLDNPLKGFAPFLDGVDDPGEPPAVYPHSLDWTYLALSEVVTDPRDCSKVDWRPVERYLNRAAALGHQVAMRFYLTYPDGSGSHPENGLPACLTGKVAMRPDDFWGVEHPDYDNPLLLGMLRGFVAQLGQRYDGDPRLGFLTLGLIGLWGEWHTWPFDTDTSDGRPDYMPTVANQRKVIGWLDDAFDTTKIEARYAELADGALKTADVGFHDDSFCFREDGKGVTLPESLGGWDWSQLAGALRAGVENRWTTNSIGGEVRPEIQGHAFDNYPAGNGTDVDDMRACIELEHSTWKINHVGVTTYDPADPKVAAAVRLMGYELYVSEARFRPQIGDRLDVGVTIENRGVAPFYYRWPVQVGLRDDRGRVVRHWTTGWDLRDIQPLRIRTFPEWQTGQDYVAFGTPVSLRTSAGLRGVRDGRYELVMRVVNPLPKGKKLRFANATQGADGWLVLGSLRVDR